MKTRYPSLPINSNASTAAVFKSGSAGSGVLSKGVIMAKSPSIPPGIDQAIAALRKRQKIDDASVVHQETIQADTGDVLQLFRIVSAANPNGPQHTVFLDAAGTE